MARLMAVTALLLLLVGVPLLALLGLLLPALGRAKLDLTLAVVRQDF